MSHLHRQLLTGLVAFASVLLNPALGMAQVSATLVAGGFDHPMAFVQDPSNPTLQVVVEQCGRVRLLKDGLLQPGDYLNLAGVGPCTGEQGLLGFAFSPDYAVSGRVYVNFINADGHTVVARFTRAPGTTLRADPASRFDLVWPTGLAFIIQPFVNHNGGNLAFGPDGFLYIGLGDGGSGDDPFHNSQNPTSLLGKMLRIDVSVSSDDPRGYKVPSSNPFNGPDGVLDEIWALGLRNPWRWSFDSEALGGTGALVIGDVGQGAWEEVDYAPKGPGGRNFGWSNREGAHDNQNPSARSVPPFSAALTDPIIEYSHAVGVAVIGGFVYRGAALGPGFWGRYIFADLNGRVWSVRLDISPSTGEATAADLVEHSDTLPVRGELISSFGTDSRGEVYVLAYALGQVYKLVPIGPGPSSGCPTTQPGLAWTCVNGGWLPPGSPSATAPASSAPPPAPPAADACLTTKPGSDWVCVSGGWLPPGTGLVTSGTRPGGSPTPPPPVSASPCLSTRPGSDWVCLNGAWLPPNSPLLQGTGGTGNPTPTAPPPPAPAALPVCSGLAGAPASGWVWIGRGWVPPNHPLAATGVCTSP